MLQWITHRDEKTCEVHYTLYDHECDATVASIYKRGKYSKPFRVQILDRVPWHRKSLKIAKNDAEHIYLNT